MADLIERDTALAYIDCCLGNSFGGRKEFDSGLMQARKFVTSVPSVNRWIPVEDALPEVLQNVLVCTDINTVTIAWINGNGWTFADTGNGHTENWSFDDVKYWMNLPEPPKGEKK